MSESNSRSRVGVRELRQNLSVYLDRVKAGEALDVTERGQVVARLVPSHGDADSAYQRMVTDGTIRPARRATAELGPPLPAVGRPLSEVLLELRDEDQR
jgi:prevent-host-death family protein